MAAFTLIEVLFAFAVLAIGLLGVSLYFSNATLFQRFGSEYSIANSAANAVLEYCFTVDFLTLPSLHGRVLTFKPDSTCPSLAASSFGASPTGLGGSDKGEPYTDANGNVKIDWDDNTGSLAVQRDNIYQGTQTGEVFTDSNSNGQWDPPSRSIQIFVTNMECTAFVDTDPATASAPIVGYKDPTETLVHENAAQFPGRCFWNDPNPVYSPLASASGYICPLAATCDSASIDANRSMRILIRVNWEGGRGQSKLEIRTIRALY